MASKLEEVAAELYALRPEEFVSARDERIRAARADGDKALAAELGRLRRPTQSAWLVNTLWRHQQPVVEELLDLADRFRDAMARGSGSDLQELTRARRSTESTLIRQVRALASSAGITVSADMLREVEQTLSAAMADPEVADEVRSGRLVRPAAASGFGVGPPALAVVAGGRSDGESEDADEGAGGNGEGDPQRDEERRARAELDAATAELAERRRDAKRAGQERADVAAELDRLRERESDLREQLAEAERHVREAEVRLGEAESADSEARRRHREAEEAYERAHTAMQMWR